VRIRNKTRVRQFSLVVGCDLILAEQFGTRPARRFDEVREEMPPFEVVDGVANEFINQPMKFLQRRSEHRADLQAA
jgi:hypothetical protein